MYYDMGTVRGLIRLDDEQYINWTLYYFVITRVQQSRGRRNHQCSVSQCGWREKNESGNAAGQYRGGASPVLQHKHSSV
jgi:hypothetical protein